MAAQAALAAVGSCEDLSEYTDADESISAPTEFLAEFLSAVMLKDYETALKYCKLILQYEPNNATAKEFYPLIIEKLQILEQELESDSEGSDSESSTSHTSHSSSSCSGSASGSGGDGELTNGTTASYSSLEDEEADQENNAIRHSRKFLSTDFTNGNTAEPAGRSTPKTKQRLVEAIQRKLEDNRRASRQPFRHRLQSLARGMASMTSSCVDAERAEATAGSVEETERKTGWTEDECAYFSTGADILNVTPKYTGWDEKSPESEESLLDFSLARVSASSSADWDEKSPVSDGSLGFPFSSDSSPTDPRSRSILTVHEAPLL